MFPDFADLLDITVPDTAPRHHISDDILLAHAAGTLDTAFGLVVSTHLSVCTDCRARLFTHEDIGGLLIEDLPPEKLTADSFDRLLARLESPPAPDAPAPTLRDYLPDGLRWTQIGPGLKHAPLSGFGEDSGRLRLLSIAPGTTVSAHSHAGTELTLVLTGSYMDELGRFQPGDLANLDEDTTHQPIADSDDTCICLVATEGRLKFSGLLPRLIQPLIGI